MNIFQIKTQPHGIERKDLFLSQGFVCIGYPGVGDLTNIDKDEIRVRLSNEYGWESSQLGNHLGVINAFVNTMEIGDYVVIADNDWAHIGELGQYVYEAQYEVEGMCHRRYVEWQGRVEKYKLNEHVKELLRNRSIVTKFKHPSDLAELDKVLSKRTIKDTAGNKDYEIKEKALLVLTKALEAEKEEIRVSAAISLLRYLK